jgi:non-lysosomal glucosylceramidase
VTQLEEVRTRNAGWPVARRYLGADRVRVSLPVGGIGTGSVGFGGRGQFRDWELENHPSKGLLSELTFLACHVRGATTAPAARVLEGALFDEEVEGALGSPAPLAGLPRFAECEFETTYPFGTTSVTRLGASATFTVPGRQRRASSSRCRSPRLSA